MSSSGIIRWQPAAATEADNEETKIKRRGGDVYGRGRGWATNERVREVEEVEAGRLMKE